MKLFSLAFEHFVFEILSSILNSNVGIFNIRSCIDFLLWYIDILYSGFYEFFS